MKACGAKWQMTVFGGLLHSYCEIESDVPGIACYDPGAARQCFTMIDDFSAPHSKENFESSRRDNPAHQVAIERRPMAS